MPYDPFASFGTLSDTDLDEYNDTGVVNMDFSFTPRFEKVEKRGHFPAVGATPASYKQIRQVQTFCIGAEIEQKMEPIPDATGASVGFAALTPGEHTGELANWQDGKDIHGFVGDSTKLLLAGEIKQSRSPENPAEITLPVTWYPKIAAPA